MASETRFSAGEPHDILVAGAPAGQAAARDAPVARVPAPLTAERAVANVRGRWLADDDLSRWAAASSFTCFGSGAVRVAG